MNPVQLAAPEACYSRAPGVPFFLIPNRGFAILPKCPGLYLPAMLRDSVAGGVKWYNAAFLPRTRTSFFGHVV